MKSRVADNEKLALSVLCLPPTTEMLFLQEEILALKNALTTTDPHLFIQNTAKINSICHALSTKSMSELLGGKKINNKCEKYRNQLYQLERECNKKTLLLVRHQMLMLQNKIMDLLKKKSYFSIYKDSINIEPISDEVDFRRAPLPLEIVINVGGNSTSEIRQTEEFVRRAIEKSEVKEFLGTSKIRSKNNRLGEINFSVSPRYFTSKAAQHIWRETQDSKEPFSSDKNALLEYIAVRSRQEKYTGFRLFGYSRENKVKAAQLLFDVLSGRGDYGLFKNSDYFKMVNQGNLKEVAKNALKRLKKM